MRMYFEVALAALAFRGSGLSAVNCVALLKALPTPYVGGLLTSNTMLSRQAVGPESEPPGYAHASIVTLRLWRRRDAGPW